MFELSTAAAIACSLVGIAFTGAWIYYDRRDRARFERERRRTAFHCIRCDRLYTARAGTGLCACPGCGHENARLRF